MSKKTWLILGVIFLLLFWSLYILISVPDANASLKDEVCKAVGCPNGSRMCAIVGVPPLQYYCYENPPNV